MEKRFKSLEDTLMEDNFKTISGESNEKILAEAAIDFAKGKYLEIAFVPRNILTEGNDKFDVIDPIFYGLYKNPKEEKHVSGSFYDKNGKERFFRNGFENFKAEIQTKHPYKSWHGWLIEKEYILGDIIKNEKLPKELFRLVLKGMKDNLDIILLPTRITFKGENFKSYCKNKTALYYRLE